jgi:UDP-2-acetamido-3-amino-2,3-dideoxy-glucuronate N-acetyltransferase
MSNSRRSRIVNLDEIREEGRGALAVASYGRHVPFVVRRTFLIHEIPAGIVRGSHAHHRCEQFLLCVSGAIELVAEDAAGTTTYHLSEPNQGLYVPALTWLELMPVEAQTMIVVLASDEFDEADYIRDRTAFETLMAEACP